MCVLGVCLQAAKEMVGISPEESVTEGVRRKAGERWDLNLGLTLDCLVGQQCLVGGAWAASRAHCCMRHALYVSEPVPAV